MQCLRHAPVPAPGSVFFLGRNPRGIKKDLQAIEQKRPEVRKARRDWVMRRQPFMRNMLTRIGFIDETSLKTNMAKSTGWSAKGARLIDHAPFGHWNTQTFIAALRHDRPDPWVIDGAMNRIRHCARANGASMAHCSSFTSRPNSPRP
ncbi:MAG: hypothetical protein EA407_03820 [Rhodobacteraceae bacterium]|nr:MAG: hypothetical protein EA407_03820 [Paracoccaceae bacterium]